MTLLVLQLILFSTVVFSARNEGLSNFLSLPSLPSAAATWRKIWNGFNRGERNPYRRKLWTAPFLTHPRYRNYSVYHVKYPSAKSIAFWFRYLQQTSRTCHDSGRFGVSENLMRCLCFFIVRGSLPVDQVIIQNPFKTLTDMSNDIFISFFM